MFRKTLALVAMVALLPMAGTASAVNVAVNGGFESGDFTDWDQFPSAPDQQFVGGFDPTEGSFAARINNQALASASLIKNSNVGIGIVQPNSAITISFDARGALNSGGVAFAELFSELAGGGTSASEILGGGPLALDGDPATWTSFVFNTVTGADVSGGVTLQLAAITGGAGGSGADVYFDNVVIEVQPIPLPAAVWLFGSALGLLGWAKRRSAA